MSLRMTKPCIWANWHAAMLAAAREKRPFSMFQSVRRQRRLPCL